MSAYSYVEAPGFGLKGVSCRMQSLEHPLGIPDDAAYGVRSTSCVFATAPITRVALSKHQVPVGTTMERERVAAGASDGC